MTAPSLPGTSEHSLWHGELHIDSEVPVQQTTIDALLLLAKGLSIPSGRVDRGGTPEWPQHSTGVSISA